MHGVGISEAIHGHHRHSMLHGHANKAFPRLQKSVLLPRETPFLGVAPEHLCDAARTNAHRAPVLDSLAHAFFLCVYTASKANQLPKALFNSDGKGCSESSIFLPTSTLGPPSHPFLAPLAVHPEVDAHSPGGLRRRCYAKPLTGKRRTADATTGRTLLKSLFRGPREI